MTPARSLPRRPLLSRRLVAVAALALAIARPALAAGTMSMGVYLWTDPSAEPVRAQFISVTGNSAEVEIDGPQGSKALSRPTTPAEKKLLTAAIEGQMKALSLTPPAQPAPPYVTVEWHFSTTTGYSDGATNYAPDKVPAAVLALQKMAFGTTYATAPELAPNAGKTGGQATGGASGDATIGAPTPQ